MHRHTSPLLVAALLLLVAAGFRTWQLDRVPPGLHYDEVINNEIVADYIWAGHPAIFYDRGGREGLFHLTSAVSMKFIGVNPVGIRFTGFMWGMVGLAAAYALAARLLGRRVAWVSLAFAATSFWSMYEGRADTRSVSLIGMSTLAALAFFVAWQRRGSPRGRLYAFGVAGALLGLALYTYIAARVVPVVFALLIAYLAVRQHQALKAAWRGVLVYWLVAIAVSAPLVIYLQFHPTADMRFQMLQQPLTELKDGHPSLALTTTLQTLGMFFWRGDPQWHYNVAGTPVFGPACAVLFIVGLVVAIRRAEHLPYAFYLTWIVVGLIPGMLSEPAPHYMRTAGAQTAAYTLLGIGSMAVISWLGQRNQKLTGWAWAALLIVWLAATAVGYRDYFVIWPANSQVRLFHQANLSDMARYLDGSPDTSPVVGCSPYTDEYDDWWRSSRQTMRFLLRRTDLPIRWHDCRDSIVFPQGGTPWREVVLDLLPPGDNLQPMWTAWVGNPQPVYLSPFADSALLTLNAQDKLTAKLAEVEHAQVSYSPEAGGGAALLPADFGHSLSLLGYSLEKTSLRAGKNLALTMYWQATGQSPPFLKIFMHLLDAPDHIAAQADRQSVLADTLQVGDVFLQRQTIDLPPDLPAGIYQLSIGLYSGQTGQRLPLYQGESQRGDRIFLQTITVR
jgi:4-amino-4-deoxy-L-arabinose transferase-like glycosyltransferase